MVLRIGGLSGSGLDTDQLVSEMMKAEKLKGQSLEQNKLLNSWTQDAYNDINKAFANFILDTKKELGLLTTTSSGLLMNASINSLNWVKTVSSSDTTIADATGLASAMNGSYQVGVTQLAKNWSAASASKISQTDANGNIVKSNLKTQFGLGDTDTIHFRITGYKKDSEGIVKSAEINYSAEDLATKTIYDLVNDINKADTGVVASYDEKADRFFLQTKDTGASSTIQIDKIGGIDFITGDNNTLQLKTGTDFVQTGDQGYKGQNAIIDFGAAVGIEQSSNNFILNGINFTLKNEGSFTATVNTNVDGIYDKIKTFVDKYNEMIGTVSSKLSEKRYRDYLPLTDEQKQSMNEDDIKLWEQKTKSGLLRNDSIISRTIQSTRSGLYEKVEDVVGSYNQLTQIGITTEKYSSTTVGGKLSINETKLKEAIANDPDGVINLLFKQPDDSELVNADEDTLTSAQISQKRKESGIIYRLYDNIIVGMEDIVIKAGTGDNAELYRNVKYNLLIDFVTEYESISFLDKDIMSLETSIYNFNRQLTEKENRYYKQFSAMERAISQMQQQSSWLAQQFGSGK